MDDPPPEACEICGASPIERVLVPVAVHFKGSGFYSTDYGRSRKRGGSKESGDDGSSSEKSSESKTEKAASSD
jgi:predicted nucleic acid-binding Zn ribbon protein